MRLRSFFALSAIAASLAAPVAAQETGGLRPLGPLPARNYEPLNVPFLLPAPADGSVLGRGDKRFAADLDIVNNLLTLGPKYVTDFEDQRLTLSWARGLGGGQEVGVRVPLLARNGGILDGFVNDWHRVFGFKGGGRGDLPEDRVIFQATNPATGATVINDTRSAAGLGDIVLEYRRSLTGNGAPLDRPDPRALTASARALLKLPTGRTDTLFGSGAADFGLGVAASVRPLRRIAVHGNVTAVWNGNPRKDELDARSTLVHSLLSVEWMMDRRTSFVAQSDDNPTPVRTGDAYADQPRRAFTFGFWRRVGARDRVYLSLSENDFGPLAKQAPDLILSTGFRRGW
jgi:hypothetical protein